MTRKVPDWTEHHYRRFTTLSGSVVTECPRAKSDMTPCVARDGKLATATVFKGDICVGCEVNVAEMFRSLVVAFMEKK